MEENNEVSSNESQITPEPIEGSQNGGGQRELDGKSKAEWFGSFEGEDLGYIQNKGWNNEEGISKMLNSYKNLEKMKGVPEDRLLKLPEGEDPESWGKIYEKLGKPEKADGYNTEAIREEFKDTVDSDRLDWFGKTAHELNLTKKQHENMVKAALTYENKMYDDYKQQAEQTNQINIDKLKDEWGGKFNERLQLSKRAVRAFSADEGVIDQLEQALGSNAEVLKLFANIGAKISEDTMPNLTEDSSFGYTKEQAMSDISKLKNEIKLDHHRLSLYNSGKGEDFEKMQRLRKITHGS